MAAGTLLLVAVCKLHVDVSQCEPGQTCPQHIARPEAEPRICQAGTLGRLAAAEVMQLALQRSEPMTDWRSLVG